MFMLVLLEYGLSRVTVHTTTYMIVITISITATIPIALCMLSVLKSLANDQNSNTEPCNDMVFMYAEEDAADPVAAAGCAQHSC